MDIHIAKNEEMPLAFALRYEVFVGEQKVAPEIEIDREDEHACHIIAIIDNVVIGCARIILSENDAHIGRLAVKKDYRGKGIGYAICEFIIKYCREQGYNRIWLNSQLHAVGFYQKLGFKTDGEEFTEAGIEHIKMSLGT